MVNKVLRFGAMNMLHRVNTISGRFAVADVLAFGSEKVTFDQLVDALGSDELPDGAVICEEYEHWDKDSLIKKLRDLKGGYVSFAQAILNK